MASFVVAAMYRFVRVDNPEELKTRIRGLLDGSDVRGTVLVAKEGINGTIAGSRDGIDKVLSGLRSDPRFADLEHKESPADDMPFRRTRVRLKEEIVTLGIQSVDPTTSVGTYVEPREWNDLISDPDVLLIDTRNDYEVEVGTFRGAVNPRTTSFRDFPAYVREHLDPDRQPRIAMFCTGGIRCEKATSLLKQEGFQDVYHLKGGILKYLEDVDPEQSRWEGECFVFDDRVTVDHDLNPGEYDMCHACRRPISEEDKRSTDYERGVQCPHCAEERLPFERARFRERQKQIDLARKRGLEHLGDEARETRERMRHNKLADKNRQRTIESSRDSDV